MDIVLLCGGRGLRLGKITKQTPKPLLIVNQEPFLKYILSQIDCKNTGKVYICTGYKTKLFKIFLTKTKFKYIKPIISEGHWSWETGKRLKNLKNKISKNFLILYGDNYINFSFQKYLYLLAEKKYNFSLLIQKTKLCNDGYGNVNIKNNLIDIYSNIRKPKFKYCDLGYIKCTDKIFNYYDKQNKNESLTLILNRLSLNEKLNYIITKNKLITLTNEKKLKTANIYFKNIKFLDNI